MKTKITKWFLFIFKYLVTHYEVEKTKIPNFDLFC